MGINSKLDKERKRNLVRSQGISFSLALDEMKEEDSYASKELDDYLLSVACEKAEGVYNYDQHGQLKWMIPAAGDNQHLEVVVQDVKDKRFIPQLKIEATIITQHNKPLQTIDLPFIWPPFLYHYGTNISIPTEGQYFVRITIKKPNFCRHDQELGKRYQNDVSLTLGPLNLTPGRKEYGEE